MVRQTHAQIIEGWNPFTDDEINSCVSAGVWRNLTAGDLLDRHARALPDKVAIIDDSHAVSWQELKFKSDRLALHFHQMGLGYGDFVVTITPNILDFYFIFFAVARLGAVPVMCLPRHRKLEIYHTTALHQAKAIVVPCGEKFDFAAMVEEIRQEASSLKLFLTVGGNPVRDWVPVERLLGDPVEKNYPADYLGQFRPDPNDIMVEQLSGGTTGVPKGIPHTHNEYICGWEYGGLAKDQGGDSVSMGMTPVAHNMAFAAVAGPMFFSGGTVVVTRSTNPEDHFRMIQQHKVTHIPMVPLQLTRWLEAGEIMKKYDLSSLKVIEVGAQKVRPELVKMTLDRMPVGFTAVFGTSEGPLFGTRLDAPLEIHQHTVGKHYIPEEFARVRIVDDENREVAPGQTGELAIKSPMGFKGYFRNPEENARSFDRDGFFHTGDLVSRTPGGDYVVEGRKKDTIKRAGENVYPDAVEIRLLKHPSIASAALVGMPDLAMGERLCAFVQPRDGRQLALADIQRFCEQQGLAVYQWPERLETVRGWPMVGNKIGKRFLRAYVTCRLFEEGTITREFGNEFLKRDMITVDEVLSGRVIIDFSG